MYTERIKRYLRRWNFIRLFQLIIGISIVMEGIQRSEWVMTFVGAFFSLMPLLNIGCCGTSGCSTSLPKENNKEKEITYEEIK